MSKVLIFTEIYENSYDKSLLEMLTLMDDLNVDPSNIIVGALGDELESKETVLKSIPVSKVVAMKNNDTSNFNPNVLKILLYLLPHIHQIIRILKNLLATLKIL